MRELANALERAAIPAEGDTLRGEDLALPTASVTAAIPAGGRTMADLERDAIVRALQEVGGNRRLAAERLGIGVRTLYEKLKRYDLAWGRDRPVTNAPCRTTVRLLQTLASRLENRKFRRRKRRSLNRELTSCGGTRHCCWAFR